MPSLHLVTRYPATRYAETKRLSARVSDIVGVPLAFDLDPTPRTISGTPTAYQEFGGITTANAHGQTVGLALDTKDTTLWGQTVPTAAMNGTWTGDVSGWTFGADSASYVTDGTATNPSLSGFYPSSGYVVPIELEYTVSGYSGTAGAVSGMTAYSLVRFPTTTEAINTAATANGTYKSRGFWRGSGLAPLVVYGGTANNFTMSRPAIRRLDGNHATQSASSSRPVLQYLADNRPGWAFKFDLFDDSLIIYSVNPAGAGCTLYLVGLNSITRLDNVTIGNQYTLSAYAYLRRVLALTRAPTVTEDARIRSYLYALYGVK